MSWRGRRVLVTGADGFIGSHLTERLVEEGADVRAICVYNSMGSYGWLDEATEDVRSSVEVRLGDIRDPEFVADSASGREVLFHLAAIVSIPFSYQSPRTVVDTNVGGTLNVLEAARRHGVDRMVHTSTSEVYGTPDRVPITEDHRLKGQSPYSASKIAADHLCDAYHRAFDVPVVVLRPFNTYGPRQSMRAVLPTILTQLMAGGDTIRLGSLKPRRDMTFVSDTVDGFLRAGVAQNVEGEVIQLGTGVSVSIGELFELACRVTGSDAKVEADPERVRPEKSEVMELLSNPSRARERLGWTPQVELEDGLRQTAEWFRGQLSRYRATRYYV